MTSQKSVCPSCRTPSLSIAVTPSWIAQRPAPRYKGLHSCKMTVANKLQCKYCAYFAKLVLQNYNALPCHTFHPSPFFYRVWTQEKQSQRLRRWWPRTRRRRWPVHNIIEYCQLNKSLLLEAYVCMSIQGAFSVTYKEDLENLYKTNYITPELKRICLCCILSCFCTTKGKINYEMSFWMWL